MTVITGREHARGLVRMGGQPFEVVVSKLRRPSVRPGTVRRSLLIERLERGDPRRASGARQQAKRDSR